MTLQQKKAIDSAIRDTVNAEMTDAYMTKTSKPAGNGGSLAIVAIICLLIVFGGKR